MKYVFCAEVICRAVSVYRAEISPWSLMCRLRCLRLVSFRFAWKFHRARWIPDAPHASCFHGGSTTVASSPVKDVAIVNLVEKWTCDLYRYRHVSTPPAKRSKLMGWCAREITSRTCPWSQLSMDFRRNWRGLKPELAQRKIYRAHQVTLISQSCWQIREFRWEFIELLVSPDWQCITCNTR